MPDKSTFTMTVSVKPQNLVLIALVVFISSCHRQHHQLIEPGTSTLIIPEDVALPSIEEYLNEEDSDWTYVNEQVKVIYNHVGFNRIWLSDNGLTNSGKSLINELHQSVLYGLLPTYYPLPVDDNFSGLSDEQMNYVDLTLTFHAISFFSHVSVGLEQTRTNWVDSSKVEFRKQIANAIVQFIDGKDIALVLGNLEPHYYQFNQLKGYFRELELPEFWPQSVISFRRDDESKLFATLSSIGFYKYAATSQQPDIELVLRSYQKQWGLTQTGTTDFATCALIYKQSYDLFKKGAINLERLKQNKPDASTYLWVNIPSYTMDVIEMGKYQYSHKVIVGAPETQTPLLQGKMSHVLTYPRWNIPPSIIQKEIIPAMRRDSNYLRKKGYEVTRWSGEPLSSQVLLKGEYGGNYPFNVSQPSGESNALGIIKFLFNNNESVYLHDTNSRSLFERNFRALSHGCIRVQNPMKLAGFLLDSTAVLQMNTQLNNHQTGHLPIRKYVGIYLTYETCNVSDNGQINWYKDVYKKDAAEWLAMQKSLFILTPSR